MTIDQFFEQHQNSSYVFPQIPNELTQIHLQARWIIANSGIPYLPLDISGPWHEMYAEAQALDNEFITHRSDGKGWSSLCIHGLSAGQTLSHEDYDEYKQTPIDQVPYKWTEIEQRCPITVDYFKNYFPFTKYYRIRYMKLAPNGYIPPHSDNNSNRISAVNIALNNPENCSMVVEDVGVIPFKNTGGAIAFNNTRNHSVRNLSNTNRYHIIVHGMWDINYMKLVVKSYNKLLESI